LIETIIIIKSLLKQYNIRVFIEQIKKVYVII